MRNMFTHQQFRKLEEEQCCAFPKGRDWSLHLVFWIHLRSPCFRHLLIWGHLWVLNYSSTSELILWVLWNETPIDLDNQFSVFHYFLYLGERVPLIRSLLFSLAFIFQWEQLKSSTLCSKSQWPSPEIFSVNFGSSFQCHFSLHPSCVGNKTLTPCLCALTEPGHCCCGDWGLLIFITAVLLY